MGIFDGVRATVSFVRLSNDLNRLNEVFKYAETLRDPTHKRSLSPEEWHDLFVDAGLEVEQELFFSKEHDMDEWLARTGCTGADAERVRELLAPFTSDDGTTWANDYIVLKGRKSQK